MKKYKCLEDEKWLIAMKEIQDLYKEDELKEFMLSDLKCANWAIDENNNYIKIDYGS